MKQTTTGRSLSLRALNRTTLSRQMLLNRVRMPALEVIRHLVGMQAQLPLNPYTALWSRVVDFQPHELSQLLIDRKVVRIVVMRGTIHLVTADDCLVLRPLAQPVLDTELSRHPQYGPRLAGVDLEPMLTFIGPVLAERPRTGPQLRALFARAFPDHDPAALAYACRNRLALVQVPPRGVFGSGGAVTSTTAESWLGRPLVAKPSIDEVVVRYLAAFGPATVADVAYWSRLTGLREVLERQQPRLRTFHDQNGRQLFDVADGEFADEETPAPVRFLPEYDNVGLSHADRSRVMSNESRRRVSAAVAPVEGSVLYDGFLQAAWRVDRDKSSGAASLVVQHLDRLPRPAIDEITDEGVRLLQFVQHSATSHEVRFQRLGQ